MSHFENVNINVEIKRMINTVSFAVIELDNKTIKKFSYLT